MSKKGTCLQSYIPIRSVASPASEMVSSLIFGESYTVIDSEKGFLKIVNDFDQYVGWISENTFSDYTVYDSLNEFAFLEAKGDHHILFIPCGAHIPSEGNMLIDGVSFSIDRKLKTYHHLPISIRIQKLATSFVNMPYLWGGRTFMGMDCSGFIQVVFKANGFTLPRDTSKQIESGAAVNIKDAKACDLVFFSNIDSDKVSHVGLLLDKSKIVHSSGKVRIDTFTPEGIVQDGKLIYKTISIRRIL
jgi:hypothetical protein